MKAVLLPHNILRPLLLSLLQSLLPLELQAHSRACWGLIRATNAKH